MPPAAPACCVRCNRVAESYTFGCCPECCRAHGVKPRAPRRSRARYQAEMTGRRFCRTCGDRLVDSRKWASSQCSGCLNGRGASWKPALLALIRKATTGPTATRPGSLERIAVYCLRVEMGRKVFNPGDRNGE